jgi:2,3-diketo-5-methylthio-1-phosphopentane phosphatase
MLAVKALLVDFDGTACLQDVSELLLDAFGETGWERFDDAVDSGEMGLREAADQQVAMLTGAREEMLSFALERAELAPTFGPFVTWAEERDLPLVLASDGFAFYIPPILERAGLGHLEVVTNELVEAEGGWVLRHPNGHPECIGCGTCKMLAAQRLRERHGPIAFVGEGQSDRYGALYSDIVFAKDALVEICEQDGVPFLPWETFDDVRNALETLGSLPRPVEPERCLGWTTP